ncbi:hypothetical protein MSP7336_01840 [Mycobacterium shimoidei]|uniref:Uncharacterized protein n=1 Tax=Mycobacterium shimoidei TaxID=29313 RepID=A0A375YXG7_MYCSH|nr:hypothetical protein MSP7336_01840 [Mycobacterium shimoidei]
MIVAKHRRQSSTPRAVQFAVDLICLPVDIIAELGSYPLRFAQAVIEGLVPRRYRRTRA